MKLLQKEITHSKFNAFYHHRSCLSHWPNGKLTAILNNRYWWGWKTKKTKQDTRALVLCRRLRLTFKLLGEEHLDQQPEEEQHHDALDHSLAAEEQHWLPQWLPRVLLVVVRHGERPWLLAEAFNSSSPQVSGKVNPSCRRVTKAQEHLGLHTDLQRQKKGLSWWMQSFASSSAAGVPASPLHQTDCRGCRRTLISPSAGTWAVLSLRGRRGAVGGEIHFIILAASHPEHLLRRSSAVAIE